MSELPGAWLRQLREAAGLTQEELAERAGLATRTISNLESDRVRRPHPRSLQVVAKALGLSEEAAGELRAKFLPGRYPEPRATVVPRQLPPAVAPFAGRLAEVARLDQWLERARNDTSGAAVFAIGGMAGVGKSALAIHWAHRVAGEFPDGQLHVSLGGDDLAGQRADVAEALTGFLLALGVAPKLIPASLEDRSALYRRMLTGRRVLVQIDNARDAAQVRALLPDAVGCSAVITSRAQLTDLAVGEGARLLNLDVLSGPEAEQLLTARLGADRVREEPQAVLDLIALCARLPLALVIVAARAAVSGWPLSVLVTELTDEGKRLDALDLGDSVTDVRSVFSWSCRQLSADAGRLLHLLSLHPGPDFAAPAAASLAGLPAGRVKAALRELAQASLITEHRPRRYKLHDLLRLYAAEQAQATCEEAELEAATGRMLDHYLHTAVSTAHLIDPAEDSPPATAARPGAVPEVVTTYEHAMSWFSEEHQVLVAVTRQAAGAGYDEYASQLPHAMAPFFDLSGRWHELNAVEHLALECAQRQDDMVGQARAHRLLSRVNQRVGDTDLAVAHLNRALGLLARTGDLAEEARVHLHFSVLYDIDGQIDRSLASALRARDLAQAVGHQPLLAKACNNIGYDYARLGDLDQALRYCSQAMHMLRYQVSHPGLEASTWDSLGLVYLRLGDFDQAIANYRRGAELFGLIGIKFLTADTLSHLGDAWLAAGEADQARQAWRQALTILTELSHPRASQIRQKLGGITVIPLEVSSSSS
ncbi:MAG TPA: tetratricopeptide repeat protein [Streptosporangiaceae bacterium]|nr:tetratricopeptide repeat protein [Streptosporangiaceae bacterium]